MQKTTSVATTRTKVSMKAENFSSPILDSLNELAVKALGLRLVIIYPTETGMEQALVGNGKYLADFCKLIQSSPEGAEHCRMCHLLMATSSPTGPDMVKRCHSGASTLVKRLTGEAHSNLAILTSCTLVDEDQAATWTNVRRRGKKLGLDEQKLKDAHQSLHKLNPEKMELATFVINTAAQALELILDKLALEAELEQERKRHTPDAIITSAFDKELRHAITALGDDRRPGTRSGGSLTPSASLIDIVTRLVEDKPNLPFRLTSIAAACRITPDHFSHLFHQQHKQCFSEFLTERRLEMAKSLLKDFTLNVSQVAAGAGFQDAGYFARRFRQKNGMSPREWRQRLFRSSTPAKRARPVKPRRIP